MWKGPIFILIGIAMALLSVPMLFGFTLYDQRTVSSYEFDDDYLDSGIIELTYTFKDIKPGKLILTSRGFLASGTLEVKITNDDTGEVADEYELDPGTFTWEKGETKIKREGDYTMSIIMDEEERWLIEINAKYSGDYSTLGLMSAVLGFPIFLLVGIGGTCYGSVMVYRKRKGIEEGAVITYDEQYEEHISYVEKKKEEYEEYETSPRRKELWFEPATNPYDDIPDDYYELKRKESQAFGRKWHQRLGDDLEERLMKRSEKGTDRKKGSGTKKRKEKK